MLPSFVQSGYEVKNRSSESLFVKGLKAGNHTFTAVTDFSPPDGEIPDGTNSVISFERYVNYPSQDDESGMKAIVLPALEIPNKQEVGQIMGFRKEFKAFMIVIPKEGDYAGKPAILPMGSTLFNQLSQGFKSFKDEGESNIGRNFRVTVTGSGLTTKYSAIVLGTRSTIEYEGDGHGINLVEHCCKPDTRESQIRMLIERGYELPSVLKQELNSYENPSAKEYKTVKK